jgi:hypothetical protein
MDGEPDDTCDDLLSDRYMPQEQEAQRTEIIEWLGQVDGIPWLTDEQLAALVGLTIGRVRNLLRMPVRWHEVIERRVGDTPLYALASRACLFRFPDLSCNVPAMLEVAYDERPLSVHHERGNRDDD